MTTLLVPDADDRTDLGTFVGRAVRLDPAALVRLRTGPRGRVTAWATTPFDVLATRAVPGSRAAAAGPAPALARRTARRAARAAAVDPGVGGVWQGQLPPEEGWTVVDTVPAAELEGLTERGLGVARENAGPLGPPASLLDQTVLTVTGAGGGAPAVAQVRVPLRCLFALSGMGFLGASADGQDETVRVSATSAWLRLDARYGAVVRRRLTALPLLV